MQLSKKDILEYFELVNDELAKLNKYGEILIGGGAALTLIYEARDSTYDIDAIFHPKADLRDIISKIAKEKELQEDWLNDGFKAFVNPKMEQSIYKQYSHLTVNSINPEPLLAMKLTSAREGSHDFNDSLTLARYLNITTEKELFNIVETYTHPNQQTIASRYFIMSVFEKLQLDVVIDKHQSIQDKIATAKIKANDQQINQIKNNHLER